MDRTFDYVPRLVPANLNYLVRGAVPAFAGDWKRAVWWRGGAITDQGAEGACVGHGVTAEALASPVRLKLGPGADVNSLASSVYAAAKKVDEWEGEDYDGTSVRAGMLVGRELGWWKNFLWCKTMEDLRTALNAGPVVVGVDWYESMYSTDAGGFVRIGGSLVGKHCLLITGYTPKYRNVLQTFRWRNSWGMAYGRKDSPGNGYIRADLLDKILFAARNEAAVPKLRGQGS